MKFEIMGQKEKWLIFEKEGDGVEYKGNFLYEVNINEITKCAYVCEDSRMLDEYEILKEFLEITSVKNSSRASVKIVFRRRIEYHLTDTFLQVFIKETKLS